METILSISGKPGLYKLVSRGKMNLIVEAIDPSHRRLPAFASDHVIALSDIAMYTNADDVALWKVLKSLGEIESFKPISLAYKKANSNDLREYFSKVLPNFDRDRVHDSDIKKLFQWYDILVNNDLTDFETLLSVPNDKEDTTEEKVESAE